MPSNLAHRTLRAGMVGAGMIFDETYRPLFERLHAEGLYDRRFGLVEVPLAAVATRTGERAESYRAAAGRRIAAFVSTTGPDALAQLLQAGVNFACVATPDDRHFEAAKAILSAGVHVLIEKPSVLSLTQLDELLALAREKNALAKVVYHKLLDPDHKKLRTLVVDGVLRHVNNGYCSLLEPRSISQNQFAQWIEGRNPGTYVAVHYIKLIDFTFGGRLKTVLATGQRGIVGPADGSTWDSCQLRLIYEYGDAETRAAPRGLPPPAREGAFDIHTSWVVPENFPGYVEQEVQFRFDNGVWNAHSRKRGVEWTVEGQTPLELKITPNNHYNALLIEPWSARVQRGYGLEAIERFVREVAFAEFGGPDDERGQRIAAMRGLAYNDLTADRQTVAAVQGLEAILAAQAQGRPDCVVRVNDARGGLVLYDPAGGAPQVLYGPRV